MLGAPSDPKFPWDDEIAVTHLGRLMLGSLRFSGGTPASRGGSTCFVHTRGPSPAQLPPSLLLWLRGHLGQQVFSLRIASCVNSAQESQGCVARGQMQPRGVPRGSGLTRCLILSDLICRDADGVFSMVPNKFNESDFQSPLIRASAQWTGRLC